MPNVEVEICQDEDNEVKHNVVPYKMTEVDGHVLLNQNCKEVERTKR
jgi:hypothetical protein